MQLVLAIHSDRRQTEQIAALVRKRLAVEVVQATSAGEGFLALGDRIPDLVLTSPLLSPFDEGVLSEYLRELGAAAAHIQTLRIPVMSAPEPSGGGLFSRKKKRPESAPDGCDPGYFVEEIAEYLARAAEERRANTDQAHRNHTREMERALESSAPDDPYPTDRGTEDERAPVYRPQDSQYTPAYETYEDPAPVYRADADEDRAPIYQPGVESTHAYRLDEVKPADEPAAGHDVTPVYESMHEVTPAYEPEPSSRAEVESAPAYRIEEPIAIEDVKPIELEPARYQVAPDPEPELLPEPESLRSRYRYATPATTSRPIYEPPPAPVAAASQPDMTAISLEPPPDAHSSLILDPPRPNAESDPPFVVHSTEERIPLSDSLERAAALLEASGLGEAAVKEVERVPMHRLTTLDEIPLPEELAKRVESFHGETPVVLAAPPVAPPPIAPVHVEAPLHQPQHVEEPVQPQAPARVEPVAQAQPAVEPEAAKPSSRRTPAFEAALAAIRKAWVRPRRSSSSPLSLNLHEASAIDPAPASAPASPPPPVVQPEPVKIEAKAETIQTPIDAELKTTRQFDLTVDIDAIDDPIVIDSDVVSPALESIEAIAQVTEAAAPIAPSAEEDVYELSASPALHDIDADLEAAGPPPPVHEVFPQTTPLAAPAEPAPAVQAPAALAPPAPSQAAPARAAAAPPTSVEPPAPGTPKRDKHRKKSDKRRVMKGQKPAAKQAPSNEPAQDEWGLFDPNRCGFAALVDKLDEVTTEEKDGKRKTSVRLISYG